MERLHEQADAGMERYRELWAWTRCPCCDRHWPTRRPEAERGDLGECGTCQRPRVLAAEPDDGQAESWANRFERIRKQLADADYRTREQVMRTAKLCPHERRWAHTVLGGARAS